MFHGGSVIIKRMQRWSRIFLVLLTIVAVAATAIYWFGFPQVQAFSPEEGSDRVAAGAAIRLTFSRPMQPESVLDRLSITPDIEVDIRWEASTLVVEPKQPWRSGTLVEVRLAAGARAAGLLPLPVQDELAWSFTIRQPRLFFLYPANSAANIYWLDLKTMERTALTAFPAGVQDFSVDQANSEIYLSANNSQGGSDIYRLSLDEPTVEALQDGALADAAMVLACADAHCRLPVVSPRGDFLAFERTEKLGFPQVWLLPLKTQEADFEDEQVEPAFLAGDPEHQTLLPAWSGDGILAFYDTQAAGFVLYDLYSDESVLFPNQTGQTGAWRPKSQDFLAPEIFFLDTGSVTGLPGFANSQLILFNRLTKSMQDLTPSDDMEDSSPAFSPDGVYLAFARKYLNPQRWSPGRQLWVMMPETGQAQQITNDPDFTHYEFAWSPDSKQLSYVRFDQTIIRNPPEIWLLELIDVEHTRLVENGYWPQWIP